MSLRQFNFSNLIRLGAIGFLIWSILIAYRQIPIDIDIVIEMGIIALIYVILEGIFIFRINNSYISSVALVIYAIFSSLFFYTGQLLNFYVSIISFGIAIPQICRIKGDAQIKIEQSGVIASAFAFAFSLSIIGVYFGIVIVPINASIISVLGVSLGILMFFLQKSQKEEKFIRQMGKFRISLTYILGIIAISILIFLGITVYANPAILCYYTALTYSQTLIFILISFAIAGILSYSFEILINHLKNRVYVIFIVCSVLGVIGFLLLLFIQSILIMILLIVANIALFLGLSLTLHLFTRANLNWSFFLALVPAIAFNLLILLSSVAYFYVIGILSQLIAVLGLKLLDKEVENNG